MFPACVHLQLLLTGALATGMGAVSPEERDAWNEQGQLPEENVQVSKRAMCRCA